MQIGCRSDAANRMQIGCRSAVSIGCSSVCLKHRLIFRDILGEAYVRWFVDIKRTVSFIENGVSVLFLGSPAFFFPTLFGSTHSYVFMLSNNHSPDYSVEILRFVQYVPYLLEQSSRTTSFTRLTRGSGRLKVCGSVKERRILWSSNSD